MRPRGSLRVALAEAAQRLADTGGGTWIELTSAAFGAEPGPLVRRAARATIDNMARSGELAVVRRVRPAGRELAVYAPTAGTECAATWSPTALEQAWRPLECSA